AQIGPLSLRVDGQQLSDDIKNMFPPLLCRYVSLHLIAEKDHADLIVVIYRRKSQHRAYLRDQVLLPGMDGTEKRAGADIHQQHDGELALFLEQLAERMVESCRDIPIDKPDVIPRRILPHLTEAHAAPLEGAMIFSREQVPGKLFAFYLELPHLFQYFGCRQHNFLIIHPPRAPDHPPSLTAFLPPLTRPPDAPGSSSAQPHGLPPRSSFPPPQAFPPHASTIRHPTSRYRDRLQHFINNN